ncbi:MAG: cysteine peptidase family C39 domain-containing protein [Anaerolineae bacterium]
MATSNPRLVLDGVPRIGFYGNMIQAGFESCPEDMTLPSSLRSVLQYLGETRLGCSHRPGVAAGAGEGGTRAAQPPCQFSECSYAFLMSVCGQGFSFNWNPRQWDFGNGGPTNVTDDGLAPVRWALESVGYSCSPLGNSALDAQGLFPAHGDEAAFRRGIAESLAAGRPVIGFGIVGPPEACIITGYDEGGDVLIGWSFFAGFPEFSKSLEFEANGYFRKHNWFADTLGIVLLGDKGEALALRDTYLKTLRRGLALMRSAGVRGTYVSGIAAYDAWAASLLDDASFAAAGIDELRHRFGVHNDSVGQIAEYRSYSGRFLDEVARAFPVATDELAQAGGCYAVEHDLMWRVWECLGGHPEYTRILEEPAVQFARPEARRRIVAVIGTAKAREEEAAAHIEAALAIIDSGAVAATPTVARRAVLTGVPYIGFDTTRTGGRSENTFMCAAMKAALDYIGEPYLYEFLMGTSGAAFRLAWNADRWDGGNISTLHIGGDPMEHYRRAFAAVGWVPWIKANPDWRPGSPSNGNIYKGPDYLGANVDYEGEAAMRRCVFENVREKRYPLLAIGVLYPPECGVVTGYDDGGDVLIGWNHFQVFPENLNSANVDHESDGSYRKRDWVPDTLALIAFGYKTSRPALVDTYPRALEWAVTLARTPQFDRHYSGLAAYDAWAAALQRDEEFAGKSDDELFERLMCHNDAISCIGEGRACAARFLRAAAGTLPAAAAPLEEAAQAYEAEGSTVGRIMERLGGKDWSQECARRLAQPAARRELVLLIAKARAQDETAIAHIERALQAL